MGYIGNMSINKKIVIVIILLICIFVLFLLFNIYITLSLASAIDTGNENKAEAYASLLISVDKKIYGMPFESKGFLTPLTKACYVHNKSIVST